MSDTEWIKDLAMRYLAACESASSIANERGDDVIAVRIASTALSVALNCVTELSVPTAEVVAIMWYERLKSLDADGAEVEELSSTLRWATPAIGGLISEYGMDNQANKEEDGDACVRGEV
jgi:hypothetical protein